MDAGHMMLVAEVADFGNDPLSKLVVVIDEIGSAHSGDTRKTRHSQGIGMGVIKLTSDRQLLFFWGPIRGSQSRGQLCWRRAI